MPETYQNPYPGLRAFEAEESHLFFGREGLSEEILRRLCRNHFVAVVGTSGSGKSSLVRAGLLPLLYGGFMPDAGANWRVAVIKPGKNPIRNLAAALACPAEFETECSSGGGKEPSEDEKLKIAVTETVLRRSAVGLLQYAGGAEFASGENLLVVVDQFEEIFRFKEKSKQNAANESGADIKKPEDEAAAFVKLLIEAVSDKNSRVYVAITMRSDFLGDCAQFRDLPETINEGQYLIPRLTREQLRKAIEAPAKVYGAQMTPALVTRLLNDIGDDQDQLPVLQHAMMRTWQKRTDDKKPGELLDIPHYEATGGMAEALSRHANRAYEQLSEEQQIMAEKLFKCLTVIDGENREVRRATELGKICAVITGKKDFSPAELNEVVFVINAFRRPGRTFLMPPPDVPLDENSLIDISHESLIRKWDKLREWVEEEANSSYLYLRLAEDAFTKRSFWDEPELGIALNWRETSKPNEMWAHLYYESWKHRKVSTFDEAIGFLDESEQNRDAELVEKERSRKTQMAFKNIRIALVSLLFIFVLTMGLTIYAFRQRQIADSLLKENEVYAAELTQNAKELEDINKVLKIQNFNIETAKKELEEINDELVSKSQQLEKNEKNLQIALTRQKEATQKAEMEKQKAFLSEMEKQKALELLSKQSAETENLYQKAREAGYRLEQTLKREELNRMGLVSLEKGQTKLALQAFTDLLNAYADDPELEPNRKNEGVWWALHNLGNINWKLRNFDEAEKNYKNALETLGEFSEELNSRAFQPLGFAQYFLQPISYQTANSEIERSKIATLQRLAQLYREQAKNSSASQQVIRFNQKALQHYSRLLKIIKINPDVKDDGLYLAEIEIEIADTKFDLNDDDEAGKHYDNALEVFNKYRQQNLSSIIAAQNKLLKIALRQKDFEEAEKRIKIVLEIRQKELGFSPYHPDLAENYNDLANIYYSQDESDKEKQKQSQIENQTKADNYLSLARLIKQWNEVTKTKTKTFDEYSALANAYFKVGACQKAEAVFLDGLKFEQSSNRHANRVNALLKVADFYANSLHDDKTAEKYYLDLIDEVKKPEFSVVDLYTTLFGFIAAADFLRERNKNEAVEIILEQFLAANRKTGEDSSFYFDSYLDIRSTLAEVYKALNKSEEEKKMYADIMSNIKS